MTKNILNFFLSAAFLLAGTETLFAGKHDCPGNQLTTKNGKHWGCRCPDGTVLQPGGVNCVSPDRNCPDGQMFDSPNRKCISRCPAGQYFDAGAKTCMLEKCPAGTIRKGNECLKDSGPAAASGESAGGSQCGQVMVGGRWQNIKCPVGQKCQLEKNKPYGTCAAGSAALPAAGKNRVENNAEGYCGQVKNPNGATDTVTCGGGMSCEPLAHVSDTDASDGICKKAAPAGGSEGVGKRCGTWYSGGDVTKSCQAGLACMNNSMSAPIAAGKSGTCARQCSDPNGVNGCQSGWTTRP